MSSQQRRVLLITARDESSERIFKTCPWHCIVANREFNITAERTLIRDQTLSRHKRRATKNGQIFTNFKSCSTCFDILMKRQEFSNKNIEVWTCSKATFLPCHLNKVQQSTGRVDSTDWWKFFGASTRGLLDEWQTWHFNSMLKSRLISV